MLVAMIFVELVALDVRLKIMVGGCVFRLFEFMRHTYQQQRLKIMTKVDPKVQILFKKKISEPIMHRLARLNF